MISLRVDGSRGHEEAGQSPGSTSAHVLGTEKVCSDTKSEETSHIGETAMVKSMQISVVQIGPAAKTNIPLRHFQQDR